MDADRPADAVVVIGIDHIYVAVTDLGRSEAFYDPVMRLLGFKKSSGPLAGGERHVHYYNRIVQYTLRPARPSTPAHDPLAPGLHHLCFRVEDPADVDRVAESLRGLGIAITPPRSYPEYAEDYYAVFFTDPDGLRLEVTNFRRGRKQIQSGWSDLPWERVTG